MQEHPTSVGFAPATSSVLVLYPSLLAYKALYDAKIAFTLITNFTLERAQLRSLKNDKNEAWKSKLGAHWMVKNRRAKMVKQKICTTRVYNNCFKLRSRTIKNLFDSSKFWWSDLVPRFTWRTVFASASHRFDHVYVEEKKFNGRETSFSFDEIGLLIMKYATKLKGTANCTPFCCKCSETNAKN